MKKMAWMKPSHWNKGLRAFLITIVFLVIGFVSIAVLKSWLKIQQDAVLVALLLIPVLAYLILSDKLQEFSAGGISAKFNTTAQKPFFIEEEMKAIPIGESPQVIEKGPLKTLGEIISPNAGYLVLTMKFGEKGYHDLPLLIYLKHLSRFQNFTFLIILDQQYQVLAYIAGWRVIQILEEEQQIAAYNSTVQHDYEEMAVHKDGFANTINDGDMNRLLKYGVIQIGLQTAVLHTDTSLEVLKKMTEKKMDALIVIDENRMLKGVVEREQLLSRLLLAATK